MAHGAGSTAETLILVGLILQFIEELIVIVLALLFATVPVLGLLALLLAGVGVLWLALVYFFSYRPAREGDYEAAQTPTLLFGILSLISVSLISGILYIIAYAKLGEATAPPSGPAYAYAGTYPYGPPPVPATALPRFCTRCGTAGLTGAAFCRACGAALG